MLEAEQTCRREGLARATDGWAMPTDESEIHPFRTRISGQNAAKLSVVALVSSAKRMLEGGRDR
jgi:hypothetical protein